MDTTYPTRTRICLLTAAETSPFVLYGLLDVLGSVGALYPEVTTGEPGTPLFDVKVVAATRGPLRCNGMVLVEPDHSVDEVDDADVVIVGDMYQPIDRPPHGRYGDEIAWLRKMHARGAIIASVCSGSLILAEAGLLDGLESAGHWCYVPMFRKHYPRVKMREDLVLCLSGEHQRIITTGAVNSWQELALYLITRLGGAEHAINTAKIYLFSTETDGQLPYVVTRPRIQKSDRKIEDCQIWIAENYACASPVTRMAERAGLTQRTFARRFRAATGYQPMDYVHTVRIEEAKQILETTQVSAEEIGHTVGYEDPASFSRLFKRKTGLTPAAYRRKFASFTRSAAASSGSAA